MLSVVLHESPIHLDVPCVCVRRVDDGGEKPCIEEWTGYTLRAYNVSW